MVNQQMRNGNAKIRSSRTDEPSTTQCVRTRTVEPMRTMRTQEKPKQNPTQAGSDTGSTGEKPACEVVGTTTTRRLTTTKIDTEPTMEKEDNNTKTRQ